jgi:hypothetical protein
MNHVREQAQTWLPRREKSAVDSTSQALMFTNLRRDVPGLPAGHGMLNIMIVPLMFAAFGDV